MLPDSFSHLHALHHHLLHHALCVGYPLCAKHRAGFDLYGRFAVDERVNINERGVRAT